MKAILSVYDKTGLIEFARSLASNGVELISTGGTHDNLTQQGNLRVRQVSEITGFPEILDGRVKTLHPNIHGGLLARKDNPDHVNELSKHKIDSIEFVVVNLYPFISTINNPDVSLNEALENIDIGGPTLLRAGAKNFETVAVVVDPNDYDWVASKIDAGGLSHSERKHLAFKAFKHVSNYDTAIANYLQSDGTIDQGVETQDLPTRIGLDYYKVTNLRYGENPHQKGGLYVSQGGAHGVAGAEQLHGKELSFNNLMDADAAWRTVSDFEGIAVVIIKHTNPCGIAVDNDQAFAYQGAYDGDPVSAFGGIIGFNRTVTFQTAKEMSQIFYEVVVAPDFDEEALKILKKKKNIRILRVLPSGGNDFGLDIRPVGGNGLLVQNGDFVNEDPISWTSVTERTANANEFRDMQFAWKAAKHIKSNAIVLAKNNKLVGMGAGQPNRLNSVHLALRSAQDKSKGSVLASDAFFPFADNIKLAASGGITAIVQPGGSIRDEEVISAANEHKIAMVFTGVRHFKH